MSTSINLSILPKAHEEEITRKREDEIKMEKDGQMTNVLYKIAKDANTSTEKLDELSKSKSWCVRYAVAKNANTSAETLARLLEDKDVKIRRIAEKMQMQRQRQKH